ncbi:MAG: hypothetical protein NT031_12385 [Planctomycetota bacterium]|nr:hypothetical protein [Planctomycetota bacterium]
MTKSKLGILTVALALSACALLTAPTAAQARVGIGISIGLGGYCAPAYYAPAYYAPAYTVVQPYPAYTVVEYRLVGRLRRRLPSSQLRRALRRPTLGPTPPAGLVLGPG